MLCCQQPARDAQPKAGAHRGHTDSPAREGGVGTANDVAGRDGDVRGKQKAKRSQHDKVLPSSGGLTLC